MKLIMMESNYVPMQNTIVGYLVGFDKLKPFVESLYHNAHYLDLRVGFENHDGEKTGYILIQDADRHEDELKNFKNNKTLNLDILTDVYDVTIKVDEFERQCVILITPKNKSKTD